MISVDEAKHQLVADHSVGDYELLEILGSGNIGTVFRARSTEVPRDFALKLITMTPNSTRRRTIARIRAEVRALSSLQHPHIVGLVDAFPVDSSRLAIVSEYVDARPLSEHLGELSPEQFVIIMQQVLSALRVVHDEGFVHGDIKPSNILVGWPHGDERPHAYLVDFDLTSYASSTPPGTGLVESPEYASPERIAGDTLVPASDYFSLGTVAFEAIVGHSPFESPTMAGILKHHLEWSGADLSRLDTPGFAPSFCRLVERMLDPDPSVRAVEAAELIPALRKGVTDDTDEDGLLLEPSASDIDTRLDSEDRVWVQSGVVYVEQPGWDAPRLIECEGAYALHAVNLNGAIAYSTRDRQIWLIVEDGPTKTFTISDEPESLVAGDDGDRLVVSTTSGRTYEAASDRWLLRERLASVESSSAGGHHSTAEGQ